MITQDVLEKSLRNNEKIAYDLNYYLAENPELSGQEFLAVKRITAILKEKGIPFEAPFSGLETSFIGHITTSSDKDKPKIGILMEYDALPEIGHGCGHSASGSLSLLAALGLWDLKKEINATIDLIGTPCEEVIGEKIAMVDNGVFDSYDSVIMIHMNSDSTWPACHFLALADLDVSFSGKTAHAAASPWEGKNALNAAILTTTAIDMLRQQLKDDTKVAYIITNGGSASNVIPDKSEMIINFRNETKSELQKTYKKVENCIKGAALATGTSYTIGKTGPDFDDMILNETGINQISKIMSKLEIPHTLQPSDETSGSSDIGNVSHVCPAFHPMMAVSDHSFSLHTKEMADTMKSDSIKQVIFKGSEVISLFVLSLIEDPELLHNIKEEFKRSIA